MSSERSMVADGTGRLDKTVGQTRSVRMGCPVDVSWTSIGQVVWTGKCDKPGW